MSSASYLRLIDFSSAGLLLLAICLLWWRDLLAMVKILSVQGFMLAAIAFFEGLRSDEKNLYLVALLFFVTRVIAIPLALRRLLLGSLQERETSPLLNTAASLVAAALLSLLAFLVARPLIGASHFGEAILLPFPLATFLVALLIMVTRRKALSQLIGFLCLDNALSGLALIATLGVPLVVEVGVSLDVMFLVVVLVLVIGKMKEKILHTELSELRELHE
jgi:hydrogenase-4 component E